MGVFIVLLVYVLGLVTSGVFLVKVLDQRTRDRQRKTYRLAFPSDLDAERVLSWVRAFSGTLRGPRFQFTGAPSLCFEMWATNEGIVHRLKVPWQHVEYILPQLHSLVPGIHVTPEDNYPYNKHWTRAVEAKLTGTSRTLRIYSPVDTSASLLASVAALEPGETVLLQWVVSPTPPKAAPIADNATSHKTDLWTVLNGNQANRDEVADRRKKLEEPNLVAVLRVAAIAETPVRADQLIHRVRASLAATRGPSTRFIKRLLAHNTVRRRIQQSAGSVVFPIQLSATELTALIAWPIGNPFIAGLAPVRTRPLPASASIPSAGRVIGLANMPGAERPVALSYDHAVRHMHVLGPNGTGKTTLLANMMAQDMEEDHGVILVEGKGDLFEAALNRIPDKRVEDVIIIDVNDTQRPVGFNILDQGNSRSSIDELSSLIAAMYKETSASLLAPQVLHHMLHALADVPGHTFIDLPDLLTNHPSDDPLSDWQAGLARQIKNKDIRVFMQRFMNMSKTERDRMAGPVYNRTWEFTSRPEIKYLLGQRTSSFKMIDAIRDNKIVLVNLNGIRVGQKTAALAGTLLANAVWQAVRSFTAEKANFLYLDEFQDFAELPVGLEAMLAKARSARLGAVLAHQHSGQLRPDLRSAVLANAVTKVIFQTTSDDARLMAREFGRHITDQDFLNLGRFQAIAAISTDAGVSPPVTVTTYPPGPSTGNAKKVRELSRLRYGRPVEEVERQLEQRPFKQPPKKRPKSPTEGWGV